MSHECEDFGPADALAQGPSHEATKEHIKIEHIDIAIFRLSDLSDNKLSWIQKLQVFETCGIMSTGVQVRQHSDSLRNISFLAGVLYREAFRFLYNSREYEAHEHLQLRSIKLITWLLSLGYHPDTDRAELITADILISAAWKGNMQCLQLLLRIDSDVNKANSLGLTALHAAAYQGHAEICKMLLENGSSLDGQKQVAPSPLHLACYRKHFDIVAMLHRHGASLFRGVTITSENYAVYSLQYFLGIFHDPVSHDLVSGGQLLKTWVEVKGFAAMLESPIGAALYALNGESDDAATLFTQNGAQPPTSIVYCACSCRLPRVLSLALRLHLNVDDRGPDDYTPLQKILIDVDQADKSTCIQMVSMLLDSSAKVVGGEAILALRNLESWETVQRILSSDRDHLAERFDLIPHWQELRGSMGNSILETAILEGSQNLINDVLAWSPAGYSAEALCAACLQAAGDGSKLSLVERLLQNRKNMESIHQENPVCETTAVGIAAWHGNYAMLEMLHASIPISQVAYLPLGGISVSLAARVTNLPRRCRFKTPSFWHEASFDENQDLLGSPVNFAMDQPQILDQLLQYGYRLDRISLISMVDLAISWGMKLMTQGREILANKYASRFHSPLNHAIMKGDLEMSTLLLQLGEDINDNEFFLCEGRSPLARAIEMNNLSLIEMLLKGGADVNKPPARYGGRTALQCAAAQGLVGIAKRLVDLGADINARRSPIDGRTALEAAAEYGRKEMVQFLLGEGVETTGSHRHQYFAAIEKAEQNGHFVTANILSEHRQWSEVDQLLWPSYDGVYIGNYLVIPETDDEDESGITSADKEAVHGPRYPWELPRVSNRTM